MQRIFTRNLILLGLSIFTFNLMGQTLNTITINSPAGIAGDYAAVRANFGNQDNSPITANAAFVDDNSGTKTDGCQDPVNNITGLVAFIDRGTCEFGDKALRAQKKGAIVAIICNNAANANQAPFPMAPAAFGAQVTIPTFMVGYNDCQKIRTDIIAGGVNISIRNTCVSTAVYPPNTVWGNQPGQGDFTGGLNGWIIDKENTWNTNADGNISRGAYGGTQMDSWTDCSGIMEFNSDFLDNKGVQGAPAQGTGACPSPCPGSLISPTIDLSGQTIEGIVIEFAQATRQFQSDYFLILSKDGGVSWPDTFALNTELPVNSNVIQGRYRQAVPGYAGVTSLKMQFYYVGDYYYWGIDDVIVLNEAKDDVKVNENFYAAAPALAVPASQVAPMPILADISNIGNKDGANVKLDYVINRRETTPVEVFKATKNFGTVQSNAIVENQVFAETFTPPAVAGTYDGSYIISSTGDAATTGNNKTDFFFYVTEDTYSMTNPEANTTPANYLIYSLSPWTIGGTVRYYTAANICHVVKGKDLTFSKLTTGLANAAGDVNDTGFLYADVYKWTADDDQDEQVQINEREKVGGGSIFIDATIPNLRAIEIPLHGLADDGSVDETKVIKLEDNTSYIVAVHTAPLDPTLQYQILGYAGRTFSSFDRSMNYSAVRLAQDSVPGLPFGAGSLFGISGETEDDVETRTFESIENGSLQSVAFIDVTLSLVKSTYDFNEDAQVSTFPNPANREMYIDVTLKAASDVKVELVAMDGKSAVTQAFGKVQDERLKINLENVVSGAYSVLIHTDRGVITRKVVVQK
jgi:hypothetical protein